MTEPRRPRRLRRLSSEESRLWAEISRLITPLRGRAPTPVAPSPPPAPEPAPPKPAARPARPAPRIPAKNGIPKSGLPHSIAPKNPAPPPAPTLPPLAPLERRVRTSLRRGSRSVDAVIDLHGMRQAEAHAALIGFLHRSRASGHAVVLVVTGKGAGGDDPYAERGVLRRSVPHWLRMPELRPLVVGFEEAAHHHGGGGALYIRLRRR
ncbi:MULTISPECIES: Smr/MutS family protein [Methylobacterium]|uniref:Smr/MutS family protein n=1 Tax=Methylobacterium TaxID=407 RepID=UPI0013EDEC5A|nr:Smr/MutS family protein [Methylobacterium sp. DB0501]NGM35716.1 DNA mismatch repair protein MutS [Methylobacterium sp. DB0501]